MKMLVFRKYRYWIPVPISSVSIDKRHDNKAHLECTEKNFFTTLNVSSKIYLYPCEIMDVIICYSYPQI